MNRAEKCLREFLFFQNSFSLIVPLLLILSASAHAATFTAFGPKTFVRGSGKPVVETASFSIKNPDTTYTLKIYNGGTNSEYSKVSSAIITMNGTVVFGPSDFNQQVSFLQKQVNISSSNQLQVELRSAPGSALTVIIEGEDSDPPSVTITSPANGSYTNTPSVTVSESVTDLTSGVSNVTVNGTTASLTDETYTSNIQLAEGQNTITAVATDAAGNTGSASVSVILDTIPPVVSITSPSDDSTVNINPITVTGHIDDNSATVTVNGVNATVSNNTFDVSGITLSEGTNTMTIIAEDLAGNKTEKHISLIYSADKVPPILRVELPLGYFGITRSQSITVSGYSDDNSAIVIVNNVPATVFNNNFSAELVLKEGWNHITITATDPSGNVSWIFRSAYLDLKPPVVAIDAPADGSYINELSSLFQVTVSFSDLSYKELEVICISDIKFKNLYRFYRVIPILINGKEVSMNDFTVARCRPKWPDWQGDIDFSIFAPSYGFQMGPNVITVNAVDFSGRTSSTSATVFFDPSPPSITLTSPLSGDIIFSDKVNVTGTVSDNYGVTGVKVKDMDATITDNAFLATDVSVAEGLNTITITATDSAGNVSTNTVKIIYIKPDTIAPIISITSPADGSLINTQQIIVKGTIDDNYAKVTINGTEATVRANTFSAITTPLKKGTNTIEVTATDLFGNTSSASISLYLDVTPPSFRIDSPANGSAFNTKTITVTGYVNDNTATVTVNGVTAAVASNVFTADIPLTEGANTITVTATDPAGNYRSSTITVYLDTVVPTVTSTTPAFNVTDISRDTSIKVTFSKDMDSSSVTGTTFTLSSETENISGKVAYANNTATFTPTTRLSSNTVYTATVKGGSSGVKDTAGNALATDYAWVFKTKVSFVELYVTDPQDGAIINKTTAIIKGTVTSQTATEIGIRVNGVLAEINGTNWVAQVPLQIGQNIIEATATDASGNTDKQTITINAQTTEQQIKITTNPTSGIAPINTTFTIDISVSNPIVSYKIDFEGDGVTDLETTDPNNITHIYDIPGIYYPTVTITDNQENSYAETTIINVLDRSQMDALLKGKWEGMKGALGVGDATKAVSYFDDSIKDKFIRVFSDLGSDLPAITASFEDITLVSFTGEIAEYAIARNQDGSRYIYFIYFMKDKDGIWKIKGM